MNTHNKESDNKGSKCPTDTRSPISFLGVKHFVSLGETLCFKA